MSEILSEIAGNFLVFFAPLVGDVWIRPCSRGRQHITDYIRENGSKILTIKSYEINNKKTNIASKVEDNVKQSAMM